MAGKMSRESDVATDVTTALTELVRSQTELTRQMLGPLAPPALEAATDPEAAVQWTGVIQKLQEMWLQYQTEQIAGTRSAPSGLEQITSVFEGWAKQMPFGDPERQRRLLEGGLDVYETVLARFGMGPKAPAPGVALPELPRTDPRFADPRWRDQPLFALLHQGYLMFADEAAGMADAVQGIDPAAKEQLRFTTKAIVDALSPANFPMTNPVAIDRARETRGESLIRGMEHLLRDLKRGQLTHTPETAFVVGENIATTPGTVVYETPLYQIIQYTPTTLKVLAAPVVIFPPWINRFYILDLNPRKSFVKWAVEQGLTVFMVSWRSADASMADLAWDDYIAGQIEAIDFVRARLNVPAVHTIGYCVAGTTLAATLALLARKGEAAKVASATFFTAQVDFTDAGDLKQFATDQTIDALAQLSPDGFLDGRYLAMTFNILRGNDLIWNYVGKNYLLGEEYQAFDLLHWNGDVTNLPARWHRDYMRDLYRDNRLVVPDALSACGVPLDLGRIETPAYIQAGREDHIAPLESVWKLTRHLAGPWTFVMAGSGHIAGVVNPPVVNKYQYWTNDAPVETLGEFVEGAHEHPGSWWPHWAEWLRALDPAEVPVRGKRKPGSRGDKVVEDAPGRYVRMR
jgi:polyhydroxyalkanoate synthase